MPTIYTKTDTLGYITKKYNIDLDRRLPIEIPNIGRANLAELFSELGFRTGAEIGTERGLYAEELCKSNPNLKLYCIDPWASYPGYRQYVPQDKLDTIYYEAKNRLSAFNCELVKKLSQDALGDFVDESLDFVYIDGNHEFRYIAQDLVNWSKKVKPGGIIAGHDYMINKDKSENRVPCHVLWVVNAFMAAYDIKPWFVVGAKDRVLGEVRDKPRSWFYVKKVI